MTQNNQRLQKILNRLQEMAESNKEWFENEERYCKMAQRHSDQILKSISLCRDETK